MSRNFANFAINRERQPWSPEEDARVRELVPDIGVEKTAEWLSRPESAIRTRACRLGVLKP